MNESDTGSDDKSPNERRRPSLMTRLSIALLALFLCATGALIASAVLSTSGICVREARRVADAQLISAAIEYTASRLQEARPGENLLKSLLRQHPGCCMVHRAWGQPVVDQIQDLIRGFSVVEVEVNYEAGDRSPYWPKYPYYTRYVFVSTCGEALGTSRGMESSVLLSAPAY